MAHAHRLITIYFTASDRHRLPCPALQNPAAMKEVVEAEDADVVCLQETKLQDKAVEQMEALMGLAGWHHAWNCSTAKKGYSGTAIISK